MCLIALVQQEERAYVARGAAVCPSSHAFYIFLLGQTNKQIIRENVQDANIIMCMQFSQIFTCL